MIRPMDPKTAAAQNELKRIEAQEKALAERKAALQTYLRVDAELSQQAGNTTPSIAGPTKAPMTAKAVIVTTATELLSDGRPRSTRELLAAYEQRGVEVGGKDKVQTVSALLSQDGRFQSDRKNGWTLKESQAAPNAPDIEAPSPAGTGDGIDA